MRQSRKDVALMLDDALHQGTLVIPENAQGMIIFAHGSGSSRLSSRNRYVASVLEQGGMATLLFDLLTEAEDLNYETRFDINLLTLRLLGATDWVRKQEVARNLGLAYFGASTGAAAALSAAATYGHEIQAVVSRGGRPDLALKYLPDVKSPTLLIVGGLDYQVIELNKMAYDSLACKKELKIVPKAAHLFEETGTLEQAALLARQWFLDCFRSSDTKAEAL